MQKQKRQIFEKVSLFAAKGAKFFKEEWKTLIEKHVWNKLRTIKASFIN